jgi:hypothetical protein
MARILGDMSVKLREYGIEGIELDRGQDWKVCERISHARHRP